MPEASTGIEITNLSYGNYDCSCDGNAPFFVNRDINLRVLLLLFCVHDVTCRPIKSPSKVSKYLVSAENKKLCFLFRNEPEPHLYRSRWDYCCINILHNDFALVGQKYAKGNINSCSPSSHFLKGIVHSATSREQQMEDDFSRKIFIYVRIQDMQSQ